MMIWNNDNRDHNHDNNLVLSRTYYKLSSPSSHTVVFTTTKHKQTQQNILNANHNDIDDDDDDVGDDFQASLLFRGSWRGKDNRKINPGSHNGRIYIQDENIGDNDDDC